MPSEKYEELSLHKILHILDFISPLSLLNSEFYNNSAVMLKIGKKIYAQHEILNYQDITIIYE